MLALLSLLACQEPPPAFGPRFEELHVTLAPLESVAGDVDGDGDLDLVSSEVWFNDGVGKFTPGPDTPVQPAEDTSWDLIDLNADGLLDLVVMERVEVFVFPGDGAGRFADQGLETKASRSYRGQKLFDAGDLNGDGHLDLFIGCETSFDDDLWAGTPLFDGGYELMLGDGAGRFTVITGQLPFPAIQDVPHARMVDVDLDGDLDLVTNSGQLFLNDGAAGFTDASHQMVPIEFNQTWQVPVNYWQLLVEDVDQDGDPDLIWPDSIQLNDGRGVFADSPLASLPTLPSRAALTDVDGDGDLDVVGNWVSYHGLAVGRFLYLRQDPFTFVDATHQLPDELITLSPVGDFDGDGAADVVGAFELRAWPGDVAWNDGRGAFARTRGDFPVDLDYAKRVRLAAVADVDLDGDLDLLGDGGLLFDNDGTGVFAEAPFPAPPHASSGAGSVVHFLDADHDGDPDAILTVGDPFEPPDLLYLNDGAGSFQPDPGALPPIAVPTYSIDSGDVDLDGDLDMVLGMKDRARLYLGDGSGNFTDASANLPPLAAAGSVELGDLDGDGAPELVIQHGVLPARVLWNDGTGSFADTGVPSLSIYGPLLADFDADGDLDLLGRAQELELYLNDGSGGLTLAAGAFPPGWDWGATVFDADGDGDPDVYTTRLLLNDGAAVFTQAPEPSSHLFGGYGPRLTFDADGDGDVDVLTDHVRLHRNLARQMAWRTPPRAGRPLVIDVYGTPGQPWTLRSLPTDTHGSELEPVVAGHGTIGPRGRAGLQLRAPGQPGRRLLFQASLGDALTNLERVTLAP